MPGTKEGNSSQLPGGDNPVKARRGCATQSGGPIESVYPGRILLMAVVSADGTSDRRENVSGTTCCFPGIWTGVKRNLSECCLKLKRRGFDMSSRLQLPKILIKGLWSRANRTLGCPNKNWLHLFRPWTAAATSPSIGWYQLSAGEFNLDPQNTVCQPDLQHPRWGWPGQRQCFCTNQNPCRSGTSLLLCLLGQLDWTV